LRLIAIFGVKPVNIAEDTVAISDVALYLVVGERGEFPCSWPLEET
jgi:hypothetical protein